ncbi:MAG: ribonuclease P protein component [Alphaproteobacteria bacterium]|jgi:ribonuclease P protein component|nr:ribonuclease P protein component [Alphaproteobacteria bacterium]
MPIMRDTIKKHLDFKTKDSDPSARCAYFLIRVKPVKDIEKPRYGLVVTKKTFKHAIDRNRAKRLLRDWIAFNDKFLRPDWDYIFIARRNILQADRTSGRVAMKKALGFIRKQEINA